MTAPAPKAFVEFMRRYWRARLDAPGCNLIYAAALDASGYVQVADHEAHCHAEESEKNAALQSRVAKLTKALEAARFSLAFVLDSQRKGYDQTGTVDEVISGIDAALGAKP